MPDRPLKELKEKIGESKVTVTGLHIEAGKVEEFARALKDDNPAHRDEEAAKEQGFETIPAPMTFMAVSNFPRYHPEGVEREHKGFDLGFDSRYSIHGEQEYELERPAYVGETLEGTTTLVDVYQRDGSRGGTMTFAVMETKYRNQDGELVLTERSTGIEVSNPPEDDT